jgi:prolyl-tRNA synthetase
MRLSQVLFQTQRTVSGDARPPGHQQLLRAGLIRSLAPQHYSFLPLGLSVRHKVEGVAREAICALGGQEVSLPVLAFIGHEPLDVEGRLDSQTDRPGVVSGKGVAERSADEAILATVRGVIQSYRQLPMVLYHLGQRSCQESVGAGGLFSADGARWLDAYSFHADHADLLGFRYRVQEAIAQVLKRCEVEAVVAAAREDGSGEVTTHKVVFPVQGGGERIIRCGSCGYAADQAIARAARELPVPEKMLPMRDVETPGCKTIADLAAYLDIPKARTAKTLFLVAEAAGGGDQFVFAVVRGDTDLNESKLRQVLNTGAVGPATEAEIRAAGAEPGYGSPIGVDGGITVVVDELVTRSPNLVAGANRWGYHTLNVNYGRDYRATIVADIAMVEAGKACPTCGFPLSLESGVELASMTMVGDAYSRPAGVTYVDGEGKLRPLVMGRYRLCTDRILAAISESHSDALGVSWPAPVAPCQIYLMTAGKATLEVNTAAEELYASLLRSGIDVLYDDRDERAGVKFNDADLLGIPLRVSVGERGLCSGTVELKRRNGGALENVPIESLVSYVTGLV